VGRSGGGVVGEWWGSGGEIVEDWWGSGLGGSGEDGGLTTTPRRDRTDTLNAWES
jgi:hypothetical protein